MKKWLSLILALALALSLAACGGGNGGSDAGSGSGGSSTPSNDSGGSDAAGGEVIKIGLYTPLTGSSALVGTQEQNGVNLAVKQINDAGGINGREVSVIAYDDQFSAEGAVKVVTRLIETDHVNAIVGSMSSGNIMATADLIEEAQILELGCGTSPSWTNCGYQYVFRGTQNSASFNAGIIELMETMGATRLGTLTASTEWATNGWAAIKPALADTSIEVVMETDYMAGDTDFSGQVTKLVNADLDAVLIYGGTEELGIICKQLRQNGYDGYIYGPETMSPVEVREVAGDAANNSFFACGYLIPDDIESAANDAERAFLEAYVAEYGEMPISDTAYRGYDSVMLLAEVFKTAKSMDGPDMREALLNVSYTGIGGEFDYSDGSGDGLESCGLYAIQDGKNIPFSNFKK